MSPRTAEQTPASFLPAGCIRHGAQPLPHARLSVFLMSVDVSLITMQEAWCLFRQPSATNRPIRSALVTQLSLELHQAFDMTKYGRGPLQQHRQ